MLEVTDSAVENLKSYLAQNNIESAVRIALMQGGWAGPSLGLALDEPKDDDKTFQEDGVSFLVEEGLLSSCGAIKVDFLEAGYRSGFSITSTNPVGGGGGCSSGSCSSGTCGWSTTNRSSKPLPIWDRGFFYLFFNHLGTLTFWVSSLVAKPYFSSPILSLEGRVGHNPTGSLLSPRLESAFPEKLAFINGSLLDSTSIILIFSSE